MSNHMPVAYAYEAAVHCPPCAFRAFGMDDSGFVPETATDSEGNGVGALAPWGEMLDNWTHCDTCGNELSR